MIELPSPKPHGILILLVLAVAITLLGCGSGAGSPASSNTKAPPETQGSTASPEEPLLFHDGLFRVDHPLPEEAPPELPELSYRSEPEKQISGELTFDRPLTREEAQEAVRAKIEEWGGIPKGWEAVEDPSHVGRKPAGETAKGWEFEWRPFVEDLPVRNGPRIRTIVGGEGVVLAGWYWTPKIERGTPHRVLSAYELLEEHSDQILEATAGGMYLPGEPTEGDGDGPALPRTVYIDRMRLVYWSLDTPGASVGPPTRAVPAWEIVLRGTDGSEIPPIYLDATDGQALMRFG